jgi:hypothetical protein
MIKHFTIYEGGVMRRYKVVRDRDLQQTQQLDKKKVSAKSTNQADTGKKGRKKPFLTQK